METINTLAVVQAIISLILIGFAIGYFSSYVIEKPPQLTTYLYAANVVSSDGPAIVCNSNVDHTQYNIEIGKIELAVGHIPSKKRLDKIVDLISK